MQNVIWHLPENTLPQISWQLRVRVPNAAFGTRYPVTMTLRADAETYAADTSARVEMLIARQVFLPMAWR